METATAVRTEHGQRMGTGTFAGTRPGLGMCKAAAKAAQCKSRSGTADSQGEGSARAAHGQRMGSATVALPSAAAVPARAAPK